MNISTPTLNPSHFAEEAAAAMCLLSMKTYSSSSPDSLAFPADHKSNTILLTQHARENDTSQFLPMPFYRPRDSDFLSPLQCYIRKNCIEFFAADADGNGYVAKGRQTPITSGRIGIRCIYCKHATKRATQSTSFPKQIDKIYSAASMIQCRHFPNCAHIPKVVRDKLARLKRQGNSSVNMQKVSGNESARLHFLCTTHLIILFIIIVTSQYWADSAREIGFYDTDEDIRFSSALDPMEDIEYTNDDASAIKDKSFPTPVRTRIVSPVDFPFDNKNDSSLVRMEDKGLVQDHVFLAFAQMTSITLTSVDKAGPWKRRECGEKGLRCRHCKGRLLIKGKPHGRWFPSTAKHLGQTTTMNSIVKHASDCPHVPKEVKSAMTSLLHTSCNDSNEVQRKMKYGSRKEFFARVFDRMIAFEEPHSSLESRMRVFSPRESTCASAGRKRSRASSASDGAARKRIL